MKTPHQTPDRIFYKAYWEATGITPGSFFPGEMIMTATAIRELIKIQEEGGITPSQADALQYAKDRLLAGGDVAAGSFPSTSGNPVRVSLKHRRTGEWTSLEVPHMPENLAFQWGKNFWRKLNSEAEDQRLRERRRQENGPRFVVPDTPLDEPVTDKLLRTWLAENPDMRSIGGDNYFRTAQFGEVTLWTKPKRVMDRPSQFHEYQETDGLGYIFLDNGGQQVDDFSGSRHTPGPKQAAFEWFGNIQGLGAATWVKDIEQSRISEPGF